MRLTPRQQQINREVAEDVFDSEARVWLFGSRVDDSCRGGHIDLYVEAPIDDPARLSALENRFHARLQRARQVHQHGRLIKSRGFAP